MKFNFLYIDFIEIGFIMGLFIFGLNIDVNVILC